MFVGRLFHDLVEMADTSFDHGREVRGTGAADHRVDLVLPGLPVNVSGLPFGLAHHHGVMFYSTHDFDENGLVIG